MTSFSSQQTSYTHTSQCYEPPCWPVTVPHTSRPVFTCLTPYRLVAWHHTATEHHASSGHHVTAEHLGTAKPHRAVRHLASSNHPASARQRSSLFLTSSSTRLLCHSSNPSFSVASVSSAVHQSVFAIATFANSCTYVASPPACLPFSLCYTAGCWIGRPVRTHTELIFCETKRATLDLNIGMKSSRPGAFTGAG